MTDRTADEREAQAVAKAMQDATRRWTTSRQHILQDAKDVQAIARFGMSPEAQKQVRAALTAARAQGRTEQAKLDEAVVEAARLVRDSSNELCRCDWTAMDALGNALAARDAALKAREEKT